jgi:hypothetical protein
MDKIKLYIENLHYTIVVASLNFDVYRDLTSDKTRPQYVDIMNAYLDFFEASIHAHFVAVVVALYRLYEKRSKKDTYNISDLIKLIEKQGALSKVKITEVKQIYKYAEPIWEKICILRNNCFAHLSVKSSIKEFFKKAGLKPKDVGKLIDLSEEILNIISYEIAGNTFVSKKSQRDTNYFLGLKDVPSVTVSLLNDLKEYQKIRSK